MWAALASSHSSRTSPPIQGLEIGCGRADIDLYSIDRRAVYTIPREEQKIPWLVAWNVCVGWHRHVSISLSLVLSWTMSSPNDMCFSSFKALKLIFSCVSICGAAAYWYIWAKLVPGMRGRRLEERAGILSDGTTYTRIVSI